jgi:hypothetical protein
MRTGRDRGKVVACGLVGISGRIYTNLQLTSLCPFTHRSLTSLSSFTALAPMSKTIFAAGAFAAGSTPVFNVSTNDESGTKSMLTRAVCETA